MSYVLVLGGLLGTGIFLVLVIMAMIKRNGKSKKYFLFTVISFILMFVGGAIAPADHQSVSDTNSQAKVKKVAKEVHKEVGTEKSNTSGQSTKKEQIVKETAAAPKTEKKDQEKPEQPKPTFKKLNGRGQADSGREEPKYVGLTGFVTLDSSELSRLSDSEKKYPKSPWQVKTVKQTGPKKFEETNVFVPHKTEIIVLKQLLTHEGWGNYEGALLVKRVEGDQKPFYIDVMNFVSYPYWTEKSIRKAIAQGPFIAIYNGKGNKPVDGDEWVELKQGTEVVVKSYDSFSDNPVEAYVYQNWEYGYGGITVNFDPKSLQIKY
ncbi:hypothetical protein [Gottfriedia acidiceleris]|uniref:hypothetical protein n=1 Tax=Gottfriedia acidiceleris TaxID=371036 RepID=UPI002FFE51E1